MKGVTPYQLEILQHVARGGDDGLLDFDQLLDLLSWMPTKESSQFTIRAVVKKGLLSKGELTYRRGRRRVLYSLTPDGQAVLDPRGAPAPETRREALPDPGVELMVGLPLDDVPGLSEFEWVEEDDDFSVKTGV